MNCKNCKNWTRETKYVPENWKYGYCALIETFANHDDPECGVTFKEDFGCIHFKKK